MMAPDSKKLGLGPHHITAVPELVTTAPMMTNQVKGSKMNTSASFALVAGLMLIASGEVRAQCVLESEQLEPVMVLGNLVQPQSNTLVTGDCSKTYDELHEEYVASPKELIDTRPTFGGAMSCSSSGGTSTCVWGGYYDDGNHWSSNGRMYRVPN